jgi:hypothetical protein
MNQEYWGIDCSRKQATSNEKVQHSEKIQE